MAKLAMHFHDTYGQALANLYAGMEEGCRVIDSAAGGLGGCPYAPGATGNVATEDVVYMLEGMGIATGVDMAKLVAATNVVSGLIGRPPVSRVGGGVECEGAGGEVGAVGCGRGATATCPPSFTEYAARWWARCACAAALRQPGLTVRRPAPSPGPAARSRSPGRSTAAPPPTSSAARTAACPRSPR